jgi:DNA-binding LytR/AlgR family response regulator
MAVSWHHIKAIAQKYAKTTAMMFLGRQFNYPAEEIDYVEAAGNYLNLFVGKETHRERD